MSINNLSMHVLAVYFFGTGVFILFLPHTFYEMIPGLSAMGPFNMHFIRDVALTFIVSGGGLFYAAGKSNREVAIVAAAWPLLHALFHLQIWWHRGFPFDLVWWVDFAGVIIPGFVAIYMAVRLSVQSQK